jgi:hypothetical protein
MHSTALNRKIFEILIYTNNAKTLFLALLF